MKLGDCSFRKEGGSGLSIEVFHPQYLIIRIIISYW